MMMVSKDLCAKHSGNRLPTVTWNTSTSKTDHTMFVSALLLGGDPLCRSVLFTCGKAYERLWQDAQFGDPDRSL